MEERFTREGPLLVDNESKLKWFIAPDVDMSWSYANAWMKALGNNVITFRFPTRKELVEFFSATSEDPRFEIRKDVSFWLDELDDETAGCVDVIGNERAVLKQFYHKMRSISVVG